MRWIEVAHLKVIVTLTGLAKLFSRDSSIEDRRASYHHSDNTYDHRIVESHRGLLAQSQARAV
jgi:hypothetical protein